MGRPREYKTVSKKVWIGGINGNIKGYNIKDSTLERLRSDLNRWIILII